MDPNPSFTIGIEEEYMLVHPESGELVSKTPRSLMPAMKKRLGKAVSPEFLQSQIEIGTPVCKSVREARDRLAELRSAVASVAADHDVAIIAASTHPYGDHSKQQVTRRARYRNLEKDLQAVVRRLLISGMHVHVGVDDDDLRISLMNQATYILPHFLALSTSSPFWQGKDTGLKSYRLSIWNQMPRTGLPHQFETYSEYMRHVNVLVQAGVIEDATKVWWDLRPSQHYPTLEMRIPDLCTTLDDAICVAALYQSWLRMLYRLRQNNLRWRQYSNWLIEENRWRAHRYGIDSGLIDFSRGSIKEFTGLLDDMLEHVAEDAGELGCTSAINHARTILERGTSAHRQLDIYHAEMDKEGAEEKKALKKVVDWLREETLNF